MEILNQVWVWIVSALGGVSLAGIISAITYGTLKGAFNRTISKINVQKIADQATEKGVEKVKKVSFTHSIQPLVESELKKINEHSIEVLKTTLADVTAKYNQVINVLEKLSAYFDGSFVSEQTKQELKQALADAKNEPTIAESVVVEEFIEEEPKQAVEPQNKAKSSTKVER